MDGGERGVEAPRLLALARRFVKIFCAVLRATFKTILPLKNPFRHPFDAVFLYLKGAKLEILSPHRHNRYTPLMSG